MPVVCNDRCRMVDDMAQIIDSYGRPCGHAETVATMEVPQIQFIARVSGHFSRHRDRYAQLQLCIVAMVAAMRVVCCSFAALFGLRPSGR